MMKIGIVLVLSGIIFLLLGLVKWKKARSFANEPTCKAKVTDIKTGSVYINKHRRKTYSLVVEYMVEGVNYSGELPSIQSESEEIKLGETIEIRYKNSNPKKIMSGDTEKSEQNAKIVLGIGSVLLVVGIIMLFI